MSTTPATSSASSTSQQGSGSLIRALLDTNNNSAISDPTNDDPLNSLLLSPSNVKQPQRQQQHSVYQQQPVQQFSNYAGGCSGSNGSLTACPDVSFMVDKYLLEPGLDPSDMMSLQLPGDDIGFVVVGGGGGGGGSTNSAASAKYLGYNVDQQSYRQSAAPPYFSSNQQNNYVTDSTQLYQQSQQTQHLHVQQHSSNSKMPPPTKESQPRHVTTSPFYPSPVSDSSLTMNSNGMGPVGESSGVNSLPPSASTTSSSTTSTQPSSAVAAGSQTNLAAARAQVATHSTSATPPIDNNKSSIIACDDFSAQYYYSTPSATAAGSTSSAYYNSQQPAAYAVASISPPDNYYLNQNHQHQQHQHQFVRSHFHSGGASTVIASGSVSNSNKDFLAATHDKPNSDSFEQHSRTSQQLPASLPATPTFYQHPPPLYEQYHQQSYELMSSNSATALPSRYTNGNVLASPRLMMVQHHPHGPASPRYFYSQNGSFANVYQPRQNVMVGSNNNTSQQQFLYPPPPQQQQYYMHQQSEATYQEANQDLNPAGQQSKGGLLKQKPGRPATSKASSKSGQQPAGGLKRQISHDSTPYYNYSLIENQQQQNSSLSATVSHTELADRLSKTSPCASKKSLSKKRRKRDPNEPNKPVSAYALFFRDTQAAIKGQKPDATFGEVSKMVAHLWDNLEPEKKLQYKRRTDDAKKEYLQNLAIYRARKLSVEPTTNASNDNVQSELQIPLLLAAQHPLIHQQTVDQTIVPRPAVPVQPLVNYPPASRFAPPQQKLAPNSKNTTWSGNQPDFPAAYGYAQPHTQSNVVNGQGTFLQSYPQQHSTEPMYYHYPPQQQQQQFILKDQPLPTTPRSPSSFVNNSTATTSGQAGFFNGSQSVMQTSGVNCSNRPEHFSERQQFQQGFKQAPAAISTAPSAEGDKSDAGGIFVNSLANMGEDDEDDEEND